MNRFGNSSLKASRAKFHIDGIESIIRDGFQNGFHKLWVEKELDGRETLRFQLLKGLPVDAPLIIGDAFHNLRSALDILVADVVWQKLKERPRDLYFPIRTSRQKVEEAVSTGWLFKADPTLCRLIFEVIRPYDGGTSNLFVAVNEMNIIDKHRLLTPLIQMNRLMSVKVRDELGVSLVLDFEPSNDNILIAPFWTRGKMHVDSYGSPVVDIVFGGGCPLEGRQVVPILHKCYWQVMGAIALFEEHYAIDPAWD